MSGAVEADSQPEWGTTATHVHTMHAAGFAPNNSWHTWSLGGSVGVGFSLGSYDGGWFFAPLILPSGALITAFEVDGCDDDPLDFLGWRLTRDPRGPATPVFEILDITTGTPGCGVYSTVVNPPLEIDNYNNAYVLEVSIAENFQSKFKAVRIYYKLQVSPAPGTATFSDVPTDHWAFQHVEALAASGITAGCGGGDYCPDGTLTRAQMAVFLAKALGLHWAP